MAGQYYWDEELEDELIAITTGTSTGTSTSAGATSSQTSTETAPGTGGGGGAALTPEQRERERDRLRHLTRHRELFLTRQPETLPATYIRGKCSLQMLADFESPLEYIRREVLSLFTLHSHSNRASRVPTRSLAPFSCRRTRSLRFAL